ncbi:MAG TPA: hypothetical protein VEU27_04230 [Gemmatimonadales bacterium]|nr:hypothetical protein [Gemmatimonadales bacterium]
MTGAPRRLLATIAAAGLSACAPHAPPPAPGPAPAAPAAALARAESAYADLRALRDRIEITTAAGRTASPEGVPLAVLARRHDQLRAALALRLAPIDSIGLAADDRRALAVMRGTLASDLGPVAASPAPAAGADAVAPKAPDCAYDPRRLATMPSGADSLRRRVYACYGWAQQHVMLDGERLDRLTVLDTLARTDDPGLRRRLFLALDPVWRSVNGDDGPQSPYRLLVGLDARGGEPPAAARARALGLAPDSLERWLVRVLEAWVFATYATGGLDNLNELLHETGHAVHIAAVRTRPAFLDWPDSDPFSEALGDFVALDVYEPAWQWRWLGDSVPLADGLRARYAGIVLDVAWALFEARLERDPAADPNRVWTAITGDYLRIRPHPELSWWAMRGQLVASPGYMMNYAAGAILIAAIRARTRELHGPFVTGDSAWYAWVAPRLYRFGLERGSRRVITEFLGGPLTPAAILEDMGRMRR